MRALRASTRLLVLALLSVLPSGTAAASELLVMPYACTMSGGRPLLTPSREQGHQIIGLREQRTFTACSPVNPDLCRTWTVHRFAVDCDGARVPWISIVAAAAEDGTRRAWVEDGRLRVRMPPSWSLDPDDPCARRSRFGDGFGFGRMRRYCDDRRAMGPPPIVDMPAGFAPIFGLDAFFVRATPGVSATPSLPPPVAEAAPALPPPVTAAPAPPPKVASAEPPARKEMQQAPVPPAPEPAPVAKAPQPPPVPKAAQPPAPKVATPAPSGPVVPKIINRPDPPADAQAPAIETPAAKTVPPTQPERTPTKEPAEPQKTAASPEAAKAADDRNGGVNLFTFAAYSPAAGAFAAFMVLTLALVALFVVARRREHLQAAGRPREVAAASLGRRRRGNASVPARPVALRGPPHQAPAPVPSVPPAAPPMRTEMPRTRGEAIEILGMGVMPGASEAAMKKIVDGLRLSWHPDLAQDEADRQLRELRTKQINAAWDIIQGKRAEL